MIEILPIKSLREEDAPIFGPDNVLLSQLQSSLPVASGVVVTAPDFKLHTSFEHLDFGSKEVFEQSLTIFKQEILKIPVPDVLVHELKKRKRCLLKNHIFTSINEVWLYLLEIWLAQIKNRLWQEGFSKGVAENLDAQTIIFVDRLESIGQAFIDPIDQEVVIEVQEGKVSPEQQKRIDELVQKANKKLLLSFVYQWIFDEHVQLIGIYPYTPTVRSPYIIQDVEKTTEIKKPLTTVKLFLDMSKGLSYEKDVNGIYIESEKIVNLNNLRESMEDIIFRLVESANAFPDSPIILKLADVPEDRGGVRGTLRLLHHHNLLNMLTESILFARYKYVTSTGKKGLNNIHLAIPFVRTHQELLQIKRELAVRKILRKNSFEIWMEAAVPENIINIEDYILVGIDGMIINLDELASFFGGFDHTNEQISFYKKEVSGLIKFLQPALKQLHKSKVKFICTGTLIFDPKILEFLIENGVHGVVVQRYEAPSISGLLHQTEKRVILARSNP